MPFEAGTSARMAGKLGATRRWAKATPRDRADAARRMNAGRKKTFLGKARALALAAGWTPTDEELERSADLLQQAHLANARLKAYRVLSARRGTDR